MSSYLSADQLADLIGCAPNSRGCMKRWLDRNNWPYVLNLAGFPKVSTKYHDARMSGAVPTNTDCELELEPDFEKLRERTPRQMQMIEKKKQVAQKLR